MIRWRVRGAGMGMHRLALLSLAALVLAACGEEERQSPRQAAPAASPQQGADSGELRIESFDFLPARVTVKAGTTVRWTNADDAPHTATADDGSFDTGDLRQGDVGKVTLREPGDYAYFCEFHRFMRANITVR